MLLGFIVSKRCIKTNPQKVKGVQRVTGCLAALSCFISHLDERGLPLYRLLKKADHFEWTPEA